MPEGGSPHPSGNRGHRKPGSQHSGAFAETSCLQGALVGEAAPTAGHGVQFTFVYSQYQPSPSWG